MQVFISLLIQTLPAHQQNTQTCVIIKVRDLWHFANLQSYVNYSFLHTFWFCHYEAIFVSIGGWDVLLLHNLFAWWVTLKCFRIRYVDLHLYSCPGSVPVMGGPVRGFHSGFLTSSVDWMSFHRSVACLLRASVSRSLPFCLFPEMDHWCPFLSTWEKNVTVARCLWDTEHEISSALSEASFTQIS